MKSKIILGEEDFNLEDLKEKVVEDDTSAVVTYSEVVKKEREGVNVSHLEVRIYEGMSRNEMKRVKDETIKNFDINKVIIVQRIGIVEAGENEMGIIVSAPEKDDALEALLSCLETYETYVPFWKKETTVDGKAHWVQEADELHSLYNRMVKWI